MQKSDQVNELFAALAKARGKFKKVKKNADNPFFKSKYADLSEVVDCTADALAENGLSIIQMPGEIADSHIEVETILGHSSGQWIACSVKFPVTKQDAQGVGTAISYARRYAYSPMLNIAAEIDDDGNQAAASIKKAEKRFEDARISATNVRAFWTEARKGGKSNDMVAAYLGTLGYTQTEHLRQSEYDAAMEWARKPVPMPSDLTGTLQASLDMANAGKASKTQGKAPAEDYDWAPFWVTAKRHGVSNEDVHKYAKEQFGVDSLKKLNFQQLNRVVEFVTSQEP